MCPSPRGPQQLPNYGHYPTAPAAGPAPDPQDRITPNWSETELYRSGSRLQCDSRRALQCDSNRNRDSQRRLGAPLHRPRSVRKNLASDSQPGPLRPHSCSRLSLFREPKSLFSARVGISGSERRSRLFAGSGPTGRSSRALPLS